MLGKAFAVAFGTVATLIVAALVAKRARAATSSPATSSSSSSGPTTFGAPGGAAVPSSPLPATHAEPPAADHEELVFHTPPDEAIVSPKGWLSTSFGQTTAEPLLDRRTGGYARLTYSDALAAAARLGAELRSKDDVDALLASTGVTVLDPCILPAGPRMATRAYADAEDACVRQRAAARQWDGRTVLLNAGKEWLAGAAAGKARNYGWFVNGKPIQPDSQAHNREHTDYSQLTNLRRAA